MAVIRAAVIDDDKSSANALGRLLRSGGFETRIFSSAEEFLAAPTPEAFDCAVVDVLMPRVDGLKLQRSLAERSPTLSIIFVTAHGSVPIAVEAMRSGAVDVLEKPVDDDRLMRAVRRAADRSRSLRVAESARKNLEMRFKRLTDREKQVFSLVTAGLLNKQIGYELGTTEKTVKVQRARVMEKMEAESFADLVGMAHQPGLERKSDSAATLRGEIRESWRPELRDPPSPRVED